MAPQEIDRIECAIRHIESSLDVDPWAVEIAVEAMKTQLSAEGTTSDLISRQAAIEAMSESLKRVFPEHRQIAEKCLKALPSAQPEPSEITDEQAILHLQSTGWMQNHDREMYESGLREQLADDSGSYDSLIPYEDTISRQAAIDEIEERKTANGYSNVAVISELNRLEGYIMRLPSAQPEPHYCRECKWVRCHIYVDKYGNTETYWYCLNWDGGTDEEGYCYEWERKTDE